MKRTITCFLVALMVMNTVGYYGLLVVVKDRVAHASIRKIKSNINEPGANLIIKVPLAVPYQTDSEMDNLTGSHFTHEGKVYRTLKHRLYKDTLYLICIHDDRTTEADHQINDFAKSFAGDEDSQGRTIKLISSFSKYYFPVSIALEPVQQGWVFEQSYGECVVRLTEDPAIPVLHPPRLNS